MRATDALDPWKKATLNTDSIFTQVLQDCDLLKDNDRPSELSKNALLLWGIVLCSGKSAVKAKAFYDIL